jgi:hypothetical protein
VKFRGAVLTFVALVSFSFFPPLLGALELREGLVRLELDEEAGTFSLYYLADIAANRYVPLFFAQDPETSGTAVLDGNQFHRLGESGGFSLETRRTRDGGRFIWTSSTVEVIQDFSFVASQGARLANGVQIATTVLNRSEESRNIGLRILVDTTLGESQPAHFLVDGEDEVTREKEISSARYWVSPSVNTPGLGLRYSLSGDGVSRPDRVVFANWKRLIESSWEYPVRESRNFSLLPYSINDSAVAMYYGPRRVAPGERFTVVSVMGSAGSGSFAATQGSSGPLESLFRETTEEGRVTSGSSLEEEVIAVNDLLAEIDQLLSQEGGPSPEDVEVVRRIYEELRRRADTARSGPGDRSQ